MSEINDFLNDLLIIRYYSGIDQHVSTGKSLHQYLERGRLFGFIW